MRDEKPGTRKKTQMRKKIAVIVAVLCHLQTVPPVLYFVWPNNIGLREATDGHRVQNYRHTRTIYCMLGWALFLGTCRTYLCRTNSLQVKCRYDDGFGFHCLYIVVLVWRKRETENDDSSIHHCVTIVDNLVSRGH